jgi:uracil-DNA glycosylase family 4
MTQLQSFKMKWKDCQLCPLSKHRHNVVLFRGSVPAEVLFIGEAPGPSEDMIGVPFKGPAGRILDRMLIDTAAKLGKGFSYAITNTVCCFPEVTHADIASGAIPPDTNLGIRDPHKTEIKACNPRLEEFFSLVKPKLVITLGKVAKSAIKFSGVRTEGIIHPGALSYMDDRPNEQHVIYTRCVNRLTKWIGEIK